MGLREYRKKRDFSETEEPAGKESTQARSQDRLLFVVQKHAATRLHYDFRLEMEGVLKSWAVPKGLPIQKGDKRLAVHVEDHPLDYADFEGTIPPGNYGAGTVMVWDKGSYQVADNDPVRALESGKIHLTLDGQKLKGEWTLVKMRHPREGDQDQWLVFKSGTDAPPISAQAEDQSVLTKRSLEEIAQAKDAQWESNRKTSKKAALRAAVRLPKKPKPAPLIGSTKLPKAKAQFVEPMKCLLVDRLPKGSDWIYEIHRVDSRQSFAPPRISWPSRG